MTMPATTPGASELDEEEDFDKGEEGEKTDEGAEVEEEGEEVEEEEGVVGSEEPPSHDVIEYKAELSDKVEAFEVNVHVVVNGIT